VVGLELGMIITSSYVYRSKSLVCVKWEIWRPMVPTSLWQKRIRRNMCIWSARWRWQVCIHFNKCHCLWGRV